LKHNQLAPKIAMGMTILEIEAGCRGAIGQKRSAKTFGQKRPSLRDFSLKADQDVRRPRPNLPRLLLSAV